MKADERFHLIGKDIIRFHCLYWPALLKAAGIPVPTRFFAQGWITKNGKKLSKTTGNVIDPVKLVNDYGPDAVRYFLLREGVYGQDWDFTDSAFVTRFNADLANDLGNLVSRALTMVTNYCDGKVPPSHRAAGMPSWTFLAAYRASKSLFQTDARARQRRGPRARRARIATSSLDFAGGARRDLVVGVPAQPADRPAGALGDGQGPRPARPSSTTSCTGCSRPFASSRRSCLPCCLVRRRASLACLASTPQNRQSPTSSGGGSCPAGRSARSSPCSLAWTRRGSTAP